MGLTDNRIALKTTLAIYLLNVKKLTFQVEQTVRKSDQLVQLKSIRLARGSVAAMISLTPF